MPSFTFRRALFALALVAPLTAAHSTTPVAAPPPGGFDSAFVDYRQIPATATVASGAVDVQTIDHTQPAADDGGTLLGTGLASYYGRKFDGRRTASGETFDMSEMTAAHRTLPFGSRVRVTNADNGSSVVVRINDRGPFHGGRMIDVSRAAAQRLGLIANGHGRVSLTLID